MCNLQNEGSSERSRASESKARRFSGRMREAWKKAKGCSPGSGDVRELAAAGFRDRL
jgi:hypothetical protein